MIRGVLAAEFESRQSEFMPHLERAARHDRFGETAEEIADGILSRRYQLWELGEYGIALTIVHRDAVQLLWAVGRDRHEWQDHLDNALRQWAQALGKPRLIVIARPGWAKLAKSLGYKEVQRTYEVRL